MKSYLSALQNLTMGPMKKKKINFICTKSALWYCQQIVLYFLYCGKRGFFPFIDFLYLIYDFLLTYCTTNSL